MLKWTHYRKSPRLDDRLERKLVQLGEPFLEALRERAEVGKPQTMRWECATGVQRLIAHPLLTSDSSTTAVP